MERLQWLTLWDKLREEIESQRNFYLDDQDKHRLLRFYGSAREREEVRRVERENQFEKDEE